MTVPPIQKKLLNEDIILYWVLQLGIHKCKKNKIYIHQIKSELDW